MLLFCSHSRFQESVSDPVKDQKKETNLDEVEKDLNTKKVLIFLFNSSHLIGTTRLYSNKKLTVLAFLIRLSAGAV